jgi:hypothetical protein
VQVTAVVERPLHLLALSTDIDATIASIRVTEPLSALARGQGHALRLRSFHQVTRGDVAWADVAIVQRPTGARAQRLVERLRNSATPCICDIDDLLTDVPAFSAHYRLLRDSADALVRTLRLASAITVPVAKLAQNLDLRLGPAAPPLHTVPNYAPPPRAQQAVHDDRAPHATLVVASSDTVRVDFIVPALRKLAREPGFRILAIGPIATPLTQAGIAVQSQPLMPRAAFLNLLATCVNPIGLIPLDDSLFSQCKSPIKFFDYAVAGVPVLCSRVSPYIEVVDDGRTGRLVENDPRRWHAVVLELAQSAAKRVEMAQSAATAVAEHHSLAQTIVRWRVVLSSVEPATPFRSEATLSTIDRLLDAGERTLVRLRDMNRSRKRRRRQLRSEPP